MKTATHSRLFCTTALIGILVMPSYALAGPEGGTVTAGGAAIQTVGNATTINQATDRAIIRWDSFDLNAGESVQFNQPGAGSITVNRIRDTKASQINGHIGANGNIVLINPNGMVFGAAATVNVGSLVATTSDIDDDIEFMNGGAVKFTKPGQHDAAIVNHGSMSVRDGGLVGLVSPNVENHGIIQARLGKVALASGDIATVDFAGDGLIKLEVTDAVLSQRVLNTGTIQADGGDILLTAAQARGMVDALITNTGTLQARTVTVNGVQKTGSVTLSTKGLPQGFNLNIPRGDGEIFTTGRIDVDGLAADEKGGGIVMVADRIAVGDGSYVTASGDADGGSIHIGGAYQGGSGLPTSDMIFISEHVILNAGSRRTGKGGNIILWSDTNTRFYGHADVSGITGGGFIEVSGKERLDFNGTVDLSTLHGDRGVLLLDPTDIVISNATDNNMSGASPFTPLADDGATVLNATTLLNALASGNVIVQTRATGVQAGNITVNAALTWGNANTLTLDAHNHIIVNQNITGNNVRFVVGNDLQLNANLTGTGTLTIQQAADSGTVGIGASAVGTLNLNAADLTRIIDGWGEIVIGKSTATVDMDVRATTFADNLRLLSGTGTITFNGTVNTGANNLSIVTDGDIIINSGFALTGTGNLSIAQATASTGMGFGATQTGAVNLTNTEIGRITNGWSSITLGRTDGTGILNFNTLTWNDHLTIQSGTGVINVNGVQTMAAGNNLTILTDGDINLGVTNALTGSTTGNLTVSQVSAGTSMGFGDAQSGTINFTTAEVARIANGWNSLTFGRADGSADINIGALTWNDSVTMQTGAGVIRVNGNQTSNAASMTFQSDTDMILNGTFTVSAGTVNLSFLQTSAGTSIGVGDGQGGTLSFSNADLAQIVNGWNAIIFGRTDGTQDMNIGAQTWNDTVVFQTGTGVINILGTQTMNAAGMTIRTDADVNIAADLVGSAAAFTLIQSGAGVSMGIGTGEAGTVHLSDTEISHILNGWSVINFGRTDSTADLNISAQNWDDPLSLRNGSGIITISGTQSMVANNLSITTDADIVLNGNLTGTGSLSILNSTASASMGLGDGQAGSINLNDAELNKITNGWSYIYFGNTTMNGDMNIGARGWNDRPQFRTLNGSINFNGAQSFAGNAVSITANYLDINAAMTGTSSMSIAATSVGNTVGLGAGQVGVLNIDEVEMDFLSNTFSSITIGSTSHTGAVNIGAMTVKDPLVVRNTTGLMTISGDVNMGANNLTLSNNNNMAINADLIGTGTLSITASNGNTSMGVGTGQAGTVQISDAELANIDNGWANVIFGASGSGIFNIAGRTWNHSIDIRSTSGAMNINGVQNMGTNNLAIRTNTNLVLSQNLVGSGTLTITGQAVGTTMGIGDSQTGTLNLTNAELAYITDGWNLLVFGSTAMTGVMNVGARTWTDSVDFRTGSNTAGVININGVQNVGANNLTIRSDSNPVINAALTGTGTLSFLGVTAGTTVAVGSGAGTLSLSDAELDRITNGWGNIIIGSSTQTGAMSVTARTWNDNLTLNTSTGIITVSGAQNMGANNMTIITSGNLALNSALTGTGTLTVYQNAVNSSIVLNGSGGTINLTTAELSQITNGWGNIIFGRNDSTGVLNVGAITWNDNVTYRSGTGVITISGAQNMGANDLTIATNNNLALTADLIGTGNLTIKGSNASTTIAVRTGQVGTLLIDNGELARFIDGWNSITIGSADNAGVINIGAATWADPMVFVSGGNVIINGVQTSTAGTGTNLVYATINGAFINNAGASAIDAGAGRYLVYSVDEDNDTLGGIVRPGILMNKTYAGYGPASVVEAGSQHLYSGLVAKILYLSIDDVNKIYGDVNPAFTYTYISGLVDSDTLNDAIASYTMNALGSSVFDSVGTTRSITGNFTMQNGYSVVLTNGTLTVVKATITVEADPTSRIYGNANPTFNVSYSGFKNGEDEVDIDVLASASSTANALSNVGSYVITASGASDDNYDFVYQDGILNVTKATLTTTMQNASREYGSVNPTFTAVYTGFKNGETATVIDTLVTGASAGATANVGSYAITGSGAFDDNYTFSYVNGSLTVTKATLTATANDVSRLYGDANPAIGVIYTGFKNGETSAVIDTLATASSAANNTSGVGTYNTVAAGAVDNNYNFSYVNGTLTVNKATLTATAGNVSREYGSANPLIGVTYTGFKNGETAAVINVGATGSSTANMTTGVGGYATTAGGASDDNYDFSYVDGTLTITKAMLTATAGNVSREYGDANPSIAVTYTGFKNGETSTVINTVADASSAANTASNVGAYATTATGAVDDNYDFTYVDGVLTVTKAMLTATAGNVSRLYGDANPAIGVTYTGFKHGQNSSVIDTLATAGSAANNTSGVGSYATTASGAADNNYDFTYADGTLTVNKATVTVTAGNGSREYGDSNPALGVSYSGFKNGETSVVIDTGASASSAANATSNVGTYATTASGALDDNYTFSYVDGSLTITKAMLTATANDASRIYGDANPAIGVNYTGFKNGETAAVINTGATGASAANALSDVGTYATTASGASDNNYDFTYANGTLTINKATLTATAGNTSRAYGDANPAIGVTYTGFKNSQNSSVIDTLATTGSAANNTSGVGTYATTASGASDNNYDFTYADGVLTINKAVLTATAGNGSREYGDANPAIGVTYTGFKNGETAAVIDTDATASSAANALSNVGTYATTATGGLDNNYSFTYANGTLTVTKATLLAAANNTSRAYGDANPSFTATYTGFKNSETASVIDTLASGISAADANSNVGTYSITMSGATDNNYNFTYAGGTLNVVKSVLTARADDATRNQGQPNPALSVSYTGFKNGQNASVIDTLATASTVANTASAVGTYAITASGGLDNNYSFVYVNGVMNVLDPLYVPPPPPTGAIEVLPTTATNPLPSQSIPVFFANAFQTNGIIKSAPNIVVVQENDNFDYLWQQDNFLIAVTDAVQDYYYVINNDLQNRFAAE